LLSIVSTDAVEMAKPAPCHPERSSTMRDAHRTAESKDPCPYERDSTKAPSSWFLGAASRQVRLWCTPLVRLWISYADHRNRRRNPVCYCFGALTIGASIRH